MTATMFWAPAFRHKGRFSCRDSSQALSDQGPLAGGLVAIVPADINFDLVDASIPRVWLSQAAP